MTKLKTVVIIVCALFLACVITVTTFAWLGLDQNTITARIAGSLVTEYFHCGSGSADDPFVITRPIHYYHMVEFFQRLTNLPVVYHEDDIIVKFGEEFLFFQIGCSEDRLYDPSLPASYDEGETCYVFEYDNTGELQTEIYNQQERGKKSDTLNMAYYSGERTMMPIGSSEIPFVGQLDGKGLTVSNLFITSTSTVDVHTYDNEGNIETTNTVDRSTCDIGVFGYVGPGGVPHGGSETYTSTIKDVYYNNVTIDLSNLDPTAIESVVTDENDVVLSEHTVSNTIHKNGTCYAGYIAGHITLASSVQDVYINNSTILGGAAAEIGFGYFGCVEDSDLHQSVQTLGETIGTQFGKGEDPGWGGSVDMKSLYLRLNEIAGKASGSVYYPTSIVQVNDLDTGEITRYVVSANNQVSTTTQVGNTYRLRMRAYQSVLGGSYYFNDYNGHNPYIYLTGRNHLQKYTVSYYESYESDEGIAYFFSDVEKINYLGVSSSVAIANANSNTAAKWIQEDIADSNYSYLYTYIGLDKYYLNSSGTSLTLSTTRNNTWRVAEDVSGSIEISTVVGGTTYYLNFNEEWNLTTAATTYSLSDGNNHYLSMTTTGVTNSNSAAASSEWQIQEENNLTYFKAILNGTTYYLAFDNGLTVSTSAYGWTSDNSSYYTTANGTQWYIAYEDGWKCVSLTGKTISCSVNGQTVFLLANEGLNGVVASANGNKYSALWQISDPEGSSTTFSVKIDGKTKYLDCNPTTGELVLVNDVATWSKQNNSYYILKNGVSYFITCNGNEWSVESVSKFTLSYNGMYLVANPEDDSVYALNETVDSASAWTLETRASGHSSIYATINTRKYYLSLADDGNGNVYLCVSSEEVIWNQDDLGWYTTYYGGNYYISYNTTNDEWEAAFVFNTISFNGNYLALNASKTGIVSINSITDSAKWQMNYSNSGVTDIWCVIDGTRYYLAPASISGSVTGDMVAANPLTVLSTTFSWTVTNNSISYVGSNNTYYVQCVNNKFTLAPNGWIFFKDSGNHYLQLGYVGTTGNGTVSAVTDNCNQGCFIVYDSTNHTLSAYIGDEQIVLSYDYNIYGTLTTQNIGKSTKYNYSWNEDNSQYYTQNGNDGVRHYVNYSNSAFVAEEEDWIVISNSGQTHYFGVNPGKTAFADLTSFTGTLHQWHLDGSGHLFVEVDGEKKFLNKSQSGYALSFSLDSSSSTVWSTDDGGDTYYTIIDGRKYFVTYDISTGWGLYCGAWYSISSGDNYLSINNGSVSNSTTLIDDSKWQISLLPENVSESTPASIYRMNGNDKVYLGVNMLNGQLTYSTTQQDWYKDESGFYAFDSAKGIRYHIVYENSQWKTKVIVYYTIRSDGLYLTWNESSGVSINGSDSVFDTSKWHLSNAGTTTNTQTTIAIVASDFTIRYLGVNNDASLSVSASPTTWTRDANGYYYAYSPNSTKYYLAYDYGWCGLKYTSWSYLVSNGHYLSFVNDSTVDNSLTAITGKNENARWEISNSGTIYNLGLGKYLTSNSVSVSLSSNSVTWNIVGNTYQYNNDYLTYDTTYGTGWNKLDTANCIQIKCGNYVLGTNGTSLTNNTGAVKWYYGPNNRIWTYYQGIPYYLNYNANQSSKLSISTTASSTWTDGTNDYPNAFYTTINSVKYYLTYDSEGWVNGVTGWIATPLQYLISSGSNYLSVKGQGTSGVTNQTNKSNATKWTFSNVSTSPSGTIATNHNSQTVYLAHTNDGSDSDLSIETSSVSWNNGGSNLYTRVSGCSRNAYVVYSSGWKLNSSSGTLSFTPTVKSITVDNATLSNTVTNNSNEISNQQIQQVKPLNNVSVAAGVDGLNISFAIGSYLNRLQNVVKSLENINVLTSDVNGPTFNPAAPNTNPLIFSNLLEYNKPGITIAQKTKSFYVSKTDTRPQVITHIRDTQENGGIATWFPLILATSDEDDPTSWDSSDYRVHPTKNTGYIVSGANSTDASVSRYLSDIRVSNYGTKDIYISTNSSQNNSVNFTSAINAQLEVLTRTASSNGWKRITDSFNSAHSSVNAGLRGYNAMTLEALGLNKYEFTYEEEGDMVLGGARSGLYEMLSGGTNIYGLHFMNATISEERIVIADQVSIFSNTYTNYQLPEDCIDCNINSRGAISFFAGTYFSGNEAFFSLHQIFRNSNHSIIAIKEISKIFQHSEKKDSKNYIYLYSDGLWSDGVSRSANATPDGYELVFDMEWSKSPTIVNNAVYYLEIPVNEGEYALGTVEGKTGAYLMYLDIATSGGAEAVTRVSSEGNGVSDAFDVEYRTSPDTTNNMLFQFSIDVPDEATKENFSIDVAFARNRVVNGDTVPLPDDYSNGLYTITIVNRTGEDLNLVVFLCDDDALPGNDYLYAYRIIYTNSTGTTTLEDDNGNDYFKACDEYVLSASG
ncbi:MAG: hypothetical protein K6F14_06960 [Clostridiales bacterium]|nr:hypothetical protein [Clostridiales bacterium]